MELFFIFSREPPIIFRSFLRAFLHFLQRFKRIFLTFFSIYWRALSTFFAAFIFYLLCNCLRELLTYLQIFKGTFSSFFATISVGFLPFLKLFKDIFYLFYSYSRALSIFYSYIKTLFVPFLLAFQGRYLFICSYFNALFPQFLLDFQGCLLPLQRPQPRKRGHKGGLHGQEGSGPPLWLGQRKVQLRQSGPGAHVPVCVVVQGRMGEHHVHRSGRRWCG